MARTIRLSTWREIGTVTRLRRTVALESAHLAVKRGEGSEPFLLALAKAIMQRDRVYTFLAEDEGKPVGYITIVVGKYAKVRGNAYIVVGVLASHRGKGIGSSLLQRAEEFARERSMHRIELEVFSSNEGAKRLYERNGYQVEGIKREAVKRSGGYDDIIIMGKLLAGAQPTVSTIQGALSKVL